MSGAALRRARSVRIRGLYGVADAGFGDPLSLGRELFAAGCPVVQLRCKGWPTEAIARAAQALRPFAEAQGALLVINDDLEAALASGAHGLHLGQDDGDLQTARARLGPGPILGRSTHDPGQALRAAEEGADYIGFGPIFPTRTKADAGPTVGLSGLGDALDRLRAHGHQDLSVVAIGGIDRRRLAALRATGVQAWAVLSDLLRPGPGDPRSLRERARDFLASPLSSGHLFG